MLLTSDEVDCLEYKLAELGNCKYLKSTLKFVQLTFSVWKHEFYK